MLGSSPREFTINGDVVEAWNGQNTMVSLAAHRVVGSSPIISTNSIVCMWFETLLARIHLPLPTLRTHEKGGVKIPIGGFRNFWGIAQLVEQTLDKR